MVTSSRENLLQAGLKTIFMYGYHGASVRDIVAEAHAAQGTFTNHFQSKEAFVGEVLDLYFDHVKSLIKEAMDDTTLSPRGKLLRYIDIVSDQLAADGYTRGCLIGDLSAEVTMQSSALRSKLQDVYAEWLIPFTDCITAAQNQGEITHDFSPMDMADFLLASWEGAILRMKVEQSPAALDRFKRIVTTTLFT